MSRVSVPKYKIDRRLGVNLWGRPKSPFNTRPSKPGQHGQGAKRRRGKQSNYGLQLSEKQKFQFYYGMKERQFRLFFKKATKGDNVAESLISLLESRLDAAVYRMKFAATIFASKQLIKHKHVLVNGRVVSIASYLLKADDVITLKDDMKNHDIVNFAIALQEREVPAYYEIADDKKTGKLIKLPVLAEVPYSTTMNPNLVVEYYSRRI